MKIGGTTLTTTLKRCPTSVFYVGCAAVDGAVDFSPIQVVEMYFPGG